MALTCRLSCQELFIHVFYFPLEHACTRVVWYARLTHRPHLFLGLGFWVPQPVGINLSHPLEHSRELSSWTSVLIDQSAS